MNSLQSFDYGLPGGSPISRPVRPHANSAAYWTYLRLIEYIERFENNLSYEEEIGARLVSFGSVVTFRIERIGYYEPDIITFYGIDEGRNRVQLIQHASQLNVLLTAFRKMEDKPKRLRLTDKRKNGD